MASKKKQCFPLIILQRFASRDPGEERPIPCRAREILGVFTFAALASSTDNRAVTEGLPPDTRSVVMSERAGEWKVFPSPRRSVTLAAELEKSL